MVETSRQVRIDNWGIYFLQRLQLFFSKTDYCDLTLQFEGNVQLKVHRLVMNACTEYFAFLEQTCPALEENTIIMPSDLQADVIVPIVNFMYTGMLEFHPSIYDRLYRAAETMNIAVLTKLLEAQLAPISKITNRGKRDKEKDISSWKETKRVPKAASPLPELPAPLPGKKLPVWKKRTQNTLQSHPVSATFTTTRWNSDPIEKDPLTLADNTPKPTRFEWPDEDLAPISAMYPSFDDVSLTSKPLWTKEDDHKPVIEESPKIVQYPARRNSNSVCLDYEEEFNEKEQKVNVQQLEESLSSDNAAKRKADENKVTSSPKRVKITNQEDETIISITTSNPNEIDHTKIVSEILKKYPDLVKKKKNIKLKITQSKNDQGQIKIQTGREKVKPRLPSPAEKTIKEIKKEPLVMKDSPPMKDGILSRKGAVKASFRVSSEEGPWICMECFGNDREGAEFVLYYLFRKHMADQHQVEFDSTLCKYCGKKCPKENLMVYHLYTKHGLKPPRNISFPKCDNCPFIAATIERLQEHTKTHGIDEVQCMTCQLGFLTKKELLAHHQFAGHSNRSSSVLDCAYCMKKLQSPVTLFTHVRAQHMKEARRDGVSSLDEVMDIHNEDIEEEIQEMEQPTIISKEKKITSDNRVEEKQLLKERVKIISNVKVARSEDNIQDNNLSKTAHPPTLQEPVPDTVAVTTTAAALSNIGGSIATNLGLVDIVVLDDNQQYILQQPQGQPGNAEFILPPELTGSEGILQAAAASGELNSTDELVMVLTDHDYQDDQNQGQSDNSNIVVLYSHPVEGQQGQFITSQGNILVNSEGMLEIRNGAAITTTASENQILVSGVTTTTTTTTQAESAIESIDLIRKEIEGSVREREGSKTTLGKKDEEISHIEKDVIQQPVEMNEHHEENNIMTNYHESQKGEPILDTTDSSIQDEPMEVDEIIPQEKDVGTNSDPEQTQLLNPTEAANIEERENIEETTNEVSQGQDVPPQDSNINSQDNVHAEEKPTSDLNSRLVINDAKDLIDSFQEEEKMEVDTDKDNQPAESVSGVDEVDSLVPGDEIPSIVDNSVGTALEKCPQEDQNKEIQEEHVSQHGEEHFKETKNQSSEIEENQNVSKSQERTQEMTSPNNGNDSNTDKECDVSTGKAQNDPESVVEHTAQHIANDVSDANDNVHHNYDDFTDESQQSSNHKSQKDLNKEILDDWDDTDSQQSQTQEPQQDQSALNAAENVNKLMDDWDEEDEDQTKE